MKCLFITLVYVSISIASYAQTETAYEKKCYALTEQFLRNLGVDQALLKKSHNMDDLEKLIVAANFMEKLNTEKGLMQILDYEQEMKEAEKLKTSVDFQRERAKQKQDEVEKQAREKMARYQYSDYVRIRSEIKDDFNQWLKKGEFEKTEDYNKRISNSSRNAFDSICYENLIRTFKSKSGFSSKLLSYNADTEKFGIEFDFNDTIFKDSINIPINDAPKFKDEIQHFGIYVDDKDWGLIDNYLSPTKITYYNSDTKEVFEFYFSDKNLKQISFSSSDLGLNSASVNTTFNFDEYYFNRMFETKNGSAINAYAWDCLLNRKFSKALEILERGIPLINNNDEAYPYLLTNLAHAYLFTNQFDRAHKIYFDNLKLKLNGMSWREAILQDFNDFEKRGITTSDMEKIKQELLATNEPVVPEKEKVFTKTEIEASFPGGASAWLKYIQKAILAEVDTFTQADYGTCVVRFIVDKTGKVSDVKATTMKGTKLAEVAVSAITNGPNWIPAQQNGKYVNAYRLQPITFVGEER